jgi:hypothetical protein
MNGRTVASILLAVVIITGGVFLGIGAYNAGVTQGLIDSGQIGSPGPYIGGPYGWGYGMGPGFGFFGFLATLFFIFIVIALVRAAFGFGRGGRGPWGGPGGWDRHGRGAWDERARQIHDEWHRTGGSGSAGADGPPRA